MGQRTADGLSVSLRGHSGTLAQARVLAPRSIGPHAPRAVISAAAPTAIAASGRAHHQCSPNAATPCVLSRPDQNSPSRMNNAAITWVLRLTNQSVARLLEARGEADQRSSDCEFTAATSGEPVLALLTP